MRARGAGGRAARRREPLAGAAGSSHPVGPDPLEAAAARRR